MVFQVLRGRCSQGEQAGTIPLLLGVTIQFALTQWVGSAALAQLIPDRDLGTTVERSTAGTDRITGGARRGTNLFHSFSEFNVNQGQRVYFANPTGVENILSRVTGQNASRILGTLGVEGGANLFLLNPNGILFGPQAQLEIRGSFIASTARSFKFADGTEFSATNPQAPPLLTVNLTPGLQYGSIPPGSTIANRGSLNTGQDLILVGDRLDLQGQLQAGGNLTLQAQEIVQVRDSATMPFLAQAGKALLLQGDRRVDIFALNHPNSGLIAGRNLTLRSANPVLGDARFWSGGSFRTEQLDGSLGTLESPHDPVIRTVGDVFINAYQGASLHILAGGSVEIPNGIVITGADPANGLVETVTLSDGSSQQIDGRTVPTVDIRAGVNPAAISGPPLVGTGTFSPPTSTTTTPSSANIRVGTIENRGGTVFLTNLYQPNGSLVGDIESGAIDTRRLIGNPGDSGAVTLNSRSDIRFNVVEPPVAPEDPNTLFAINVSAVNGSSGKVQFIANGSLILDGAINRILSVSSSAKPGGDIRVKARNVAIKNGALLGTATFGTGNAGNITIDAIETVALDGVGSDEFSSAVISQVGKSELGDSSRGNSGTITIRARTVSLTNSAYISTDTRGRGNAGDVAIEATDAVFLDGEDASGSVSQVYSTVVPEAEGNTGNITIRTGRLSVTNGAQLRTDISGTGNAGNVLIETTDAVFDGIASNGLPSAAGSQIAPGVVGNSGNLTINTRSLFVRNGAALSASTFGKGNAGNVTIRATDAVSLDGVGNNGRPSGVGSQVGPGAEGDGGNVTIDAGTVSVTNGALLSTNTFGTGDAGNVAIRAIKAVSFDGTGRNGLPSAAVSQVVFGAEGNGGNVDIQADTLSITNGALLSTTTAGKGNAGNVAVQAADTVSLDGVGRNGQSSSAVSQVGTGAMGDGGNVTIDARRLLVTNGAALDTSTFGTGNAGSVTIQTNESVAFDGVGSNGSPSGVGSKVGAGAIGNGGNLNINTRSLSVTDGAQLSVGTLSTGDAGNITIQAKDAVSFDGVGWTGQSSGAGSQVGAGATGDGGNLNINTRKLSVTNGAQLDVSTLGTGNAGNATIQASESVSLGGVGSNGQASGVGSQVAPGASGEGGKIALQTLSLSLFNQAVITSSSFGQGNAGDIDIQAQSVQLKDGAAIAAITASGSGGNITLNLGDWLLLRRGSLISTTAGTAQAGGDGGNITLNAASGFIVAVPEENSDITANAFTGRGGNVQVTAQGIFGLQFRPRLTPLSDITASSEFGLNGVVTLNTPDLDPSRGLVPLPTGFVDATNLIAQQCTGRRETATTSSFYIIGRGGIPYRPGDLPSPQFSTGDVRSVAETELQHPSKTFPAIVEPLNSGRSPAQIIEATGWVVDPQGTIVLVTQAPTNPLLHPPECAPVF